VAIGGVSNTQTALRSKAAAIHSPSSPNCSRNILGSPHGHPFPLGGAFGYFSYDLKNQNRAPPATRARRIGTPDCWFGFYDRLIVFDHVAEKALKCVWKGVRRSTFRPLFLIGNRHSALGN